MNLPVDGSFFDVDLVALSLAYDEILQLVTSFKYSYLTVCSEILTLWMS